MEIAEVGERLRITRTGRHMTQEGMGACIQADQSKISDIEAGRISPSYVDMVQFSHAIHFSHDVMAAPGPFDLRACLLPLPPDWETQRTAWIEKGKQNRLEAQARRNKAKKPKK
jgi:transcriptional regulator with XRE-family HTH domain